MIGEREKSYLGACKKGYLWSASWFLTRILSKLVKLCEFSNQGLDYALYQPLKTSVQLHFFWSSCRIPVSQRNLFSASKSPLSPWPNTHGHWPQDWLTCLWQHFSSLYPVCHTLSREGARMMNNLSLSNDQGQLRFPSSSLSLSDLQGCACRAMERCLGKLLKW